MPENNLDTLIECRDAFLFSEEVVPPAALPRVKRTGKLKVVIDTRGR